LTDYLGYAGIAVAIIAVIPLYVDLYYRRRKPKPELYMERFIDKMEKPIISNYAIRIRCVKGSAEKFKVFLDNVPVGSEDHAGAVQFVRLFMTGDAINFRIPYTTTPNQGTSEIVVKDGDKVIDKRRWNDIVWGSP
jgi:hypothetical protein